MPWSPADRGIGAAIAMRLAQFATDAVAMIVGNPFIIGQTVSVDGGLYPPLVADVVAPAVGVLRDMEGVCRGTFQLRFTGKWPPAWNVRHGRHWRMTMTDTSGWDVRLEYCEAVASCPGTRRWPGRRR